MTPPSPTRAAAAVLAALALPGCFLNRANTNPPIDPVAVARLQPGESTADDVAALLGAPNEVVQLGHGSAWRYEHVRQKRAGLFLILLGLLGSDTQSDRVWVFFDEGGGLTHVGATLAADTAEYALPLFHSDPEPADTE